MIYKFSVFPNSNDGNNKKNIAAARRCACFLFYLNICLQLTFICMIISFDSSLNNIFYVKRYLLIIFCWKCFLEKCAIISIMIFLWPKTYFCSVFYRLFCAAHLFNFLLDLVIDCRVEVLMPLSNLQSQFTFLTALWFNNNWNETL